MDRHFHLLELTDTIDGFAQDDYDTKQNFSCSVTVDKSDLNFASSSNTSTNSSKGITYCNFASNIQVDNVESSEKDSNQNSNAVLKYISQLLLEEGTDENDSTYGEELALLATEKVFHDILRQEYYVSPDETLLQDSTNQISSVDINNHEDSSSGVERGFIKNVSENDVGSDKLPLATDNLSCAIPIESLTAQQIQKGAEEAMKFLPDIGEFFINRSSIGSISGRDHQPDAKKNLRDGDLDQLMGRAPKQFVAYSDELIRNENFDKAVLHGGLKYIEDDPILCEIVESSTRYKSQKNLGKASSNYAMKKDKNKTVEESEILRSLLIYCSQAVSVNDHALATELISKIREHSSPNGDWSQRLAYCLVNGLEARLAGTGCEIYHKILSEKPSIIDILKVFRTYLLFSPYMRVLIYYTNQTILNNIPRHASKVHIINYGIQQGFQWPPFFEHFSNWGRKPPKIRFTMIEVPEPGFRPRKRVELIGRRLADYASSFNVPFEYEGIASKWEYVKVEDLKITNDEVVIVNCALHSEKLSDEGIGSDCPRDMFLKTIKKIKPCVFIHGSINGSYNSPFFPRRFRSALLHYSSLFEMFETNLGDIPERLIVERSWATVLCKARIAPCFASVSTNSKFK